jgi:hypothetical protein
MRLINFLTKKNKKFTKCAKKLDCQRRIRFFFKKSFLFFFLVVARGPIRLQTTFCGSNEAQYHLKTKWTWQFGDAHLYWAMHISFPFEINS